MSRNRGVYSENIPPNVGEDYKTPQSIPSLPSKSSHYTSIRPSPRSIVSPGFKTSQAGPKDYGTTPRSVNEDLYHTQQGVSPMLHNPSAGGDVAEAFRAQVLAACAESSMMDGGIFGVPEMPYTAPIEYQYEDQIAFNPIMVEPPHGISFGADSFVQHQDTGDVGESFRQQVLEACTRVALESWLDDATPDRNWTPLETRAISPSVLNQEVNKKLESNLPSPRTEVPTEAVEIQEPDLPIDIVEKEIQEEPLEQIVTETVPNLEQPSEVIQDVLPLMSLPEMLPEEPVEQSTTADVPPIEVIMVSPKLTRGSSELIQEPLSPVRDSVRIIEARRPTSPLWKSAPGSISRIRPKQEEEIAVQTEEMRNTLEIPVEDKYVDAQGENMSPELKKQHSLLIEELKVRFSASKQQQNPEDSMHVNIETSREDFNPESVDQSAIVPVSLDGIMEWLGEEKDDISPAQGEEKDPSSDRVPESPPQSPPIFDEPKSQLQPTHPSMPSLISEGSPPSLQPIGPSFLGPDMKTATKRRPLFCCCRVV